MKWINYYIYYSILGFLFETCCNVFIRSNYSSGILFGPFTPIYFFGFLIIMFLDKLLKKQENKKFRDIVFFFLSFIMLIYQNGAATSVGAPNAISLFASLLR